MVDLIQNPFSLLSIMGQCCVIWDGCQPGGCSCVGVLVDCFDHSWSGNSGMDFSQFRLRCEVLGSLCPDKVHKL